jgi:hypothetical protein
MANACRTGRFFHHAHPMSAKPSKKSANKPTRSNAPSPAPAAPTPGLTATAPALTAAGPVNAGGESWLDSSDPRKRRWGKIIFAAILIYVAALWLLALDQTFHWGIFGPKIPPLP